jgi:indole-3-glycerol phosphate synthase
MAGILDKIFADKRVELETTRWKMPLADLKERVREVAPALDPLKFLRGAGDGTRIIAEIKPQSPFKGPLRDNLDVLEMARSYRDAGAAAISVLTESRYFGGGIENLTRIRQEVDTPLLRKDFLFADYQVWEARAFGADFYLLIATWLDKNQMADLLCLGREELGMEALVEAHDERDMEKAFTAGARLIGINNRDLGTGKTDLGIARRLLRSIGDDQKYVFVCESGIRGRDEIEEFEKLGAHAFLIGESLMQAEDVGAKLKALLGHGATADGPKNG